MIDDLFGDNDEIDDDGSDDDSADIAQLQLNCQSEFKQYLALAKSYKRTDKGVCPLLWWGIHIRQLKLVAPVARKWLGVL